MAPYKKVVVNTRNPQYNAYAETPGDWTYMINVTLPVYNEAAQLHENTLIVKQHLTAIFPGQFEIVICDNGSTDGTATIAKNLAQKESDIHYMRLKKKGRGGAIKAAWLESRADVLTYMDIDLSTDLACYNKLVDPILLGLADITMGCRLAPQSQTIRGLKREVMSRAYNHLLRFCFRSTFADAQCGFKAISAPLAKTVLPLIEDYKWFMDTELLVLARHFGFKLLEVPVRWKDDPDSRVNILETVVDNIVAIRKLRKRLRRELRFSIKSNVDPISNLRSLE